MGKRLGAISKICNCIFLLYLLYIVGETLEVPCESGWTLSPDSGTCLKLSDERISWNAAQRFCKAGGGDLVYIVGSKMNAFVTDLLSHLKDHVYIGLREKEGRLYCTDDQKKVVYANFRSKPRSSSTYLCVEIDPQNKEWHLVSCFSQRRFLCEKGPTLCPAGWVVSRYSGTCIKVFLDAPASWTNARRTCRAEGGDLTIVENEEMNTFLTDQFQLDYSTQVCHIGMNQLKMKGKWRWLDYPDEPKYFHWDTTKHHAKAGGKCVGYYPQEDHPKSWQDFPCSKRGAFICEKYSDCGNGKYGMICPTDCNKSHCANKNCNERTGHCRSGCEEDYIHQKCDFPLVTCSHFCFNFTCDRETGRCHHGCQEGFSGLNCDRIEEIKIDIDFIRVIVLGSSVACMIFPFVLFLGIFLERRRQHFLEEQQRHSQNISKLGAHQPTKSSSRPSRVASSPLIRQARSSDAQEIPRTTINVHDQSVPGVAPHSSQSGNTNSAGRSPIDRSISEPML